MTAAALERVLQGCRQGLPLRFCAGLGGVTYQSVNERRKSDLDFAQAMETAISEGVERKFSAILKAGYGNGDTPPKWEALAWALERAYCAEFSRPEIQLAALTVNQTTMNSQIIITAEVAEHLQERNKRLDGELGKLSEAYEAKQKLLNGSNGEPFPKRGGAGRVHEIEAESSLVPSTDAITLPPPAGRTRGWWKMLSTGSGERGIAVPAARFVLKEITTGCVGSARAGSSVDWGENPTLSELWNAISESCGEGGWTALVGRGVQQA